MPQRRPRRIADPETRQFKLDDTDPGKVAATTNAQAEEEAKKAEEEAKKEEEEAKKKKEPGKLPARPQFSAANSRDAAADTLKKFFNRR